MIIETKIIVTDEDKKLLSQSLPKNPCKGCRDAGSCCGCPKETEYQSMIKPYKDAGILEYAIIIEDIRRMKGEIKILEMSIDKRYEEFPVELKTYAKELIDSEIKSLQIQAEYYINK